MKWQKLKLYDQGDVWVLLYTAAGGSKQEWTCHPVSTERAEETGSEQNVPILSGDRGSSIMWDSHHLASFTSISPEN